MGLEIRDPAKNGLANGMLKAQLTQSKLTGKIDTTIVSAKPSPFSLFSCLASAKSNEMRSTREFV